MRTAFFSGFLVATALLMLPALADSPAVSTEIAQAAPDSSGSELDFWNSIKASKKAEDYQAYLDKYPNGNFADLAKLRLKKYASAAVPAPTPVPAPVDQQQADIAYWNSIKTSKKADDYKAYLDKYPNGEFVD